MQRNDGGSYPKLDILTHDLLMLQNKRIQISCNVPWCYEKSSHELHEYSTERTQRIFGRISVFPVQFGTDGGRHGNGPRGNGFRFLTIFFWNTFFVFLQLGFSPLCPLAKT